MGEQMAWPATVDADNGLLGTNHRRSLLCMRVVAGDWRGRRIESPQSVATRPTTDKVRQAIFNALNSSGVVRDAKILDLFAGTGAMGIEALSRGAAHCTFIENDRAALSVLRRNIEAMDAGGLCTVLAMDASTQGAHGIEADIVIADPPYDFEQWDRLLAGICAPIVVAEASRAIVAPEGWEITRERRYGRTVVTFLCRTPAPTGTVNTV
ncbi:MAG: 16S rRNA (guanine(966)-N(2))-methyltransferase RsmD [Ilumatobacteraceae bacterium]|nr:16S rRNA (guanine(966)-N(2))-methyltransferase RsmD [Ilumatobacteraceae bacterium]